MKSLETATLGQTRSKRINSLKAEMERRIQLARTLLGEAETADADKAKDLRAKASTEADEIDVLQKSLDCIANTTKREEVR